MSSPSSSIKRFSVERRPRMLKDFLKDDSPFSNSCSSSGFKSFPRRLDHHGDHIPNLAQNDMINASSSLLRSRSKATASTTISAIQAIIHSIKRIHVNVVKSPASFLPRSLSRKLSKKNHSTTSNKVLGTLHNFEITVRVKDIIRWKSFRDLVDDKPQPSTDNDHKNASLLSPDHHHHCCTTATTTTTTVSANSTPCSSSSNGSSWCDSDFTSEYLPSWCFNSEPDPGSCSDLGEKYLPCVGSARDSVKATIESAAVGPKEHELQCDEKDQLSPVSVLDFELEENDHRPSSFRPTNLEEWLEENSDGDGLDSERETKVKLLLTLNTSATDGEACVNEMDRGASWNKFEVEQQEVSLQIENTLLNLLLDELLLDV